MSIVGLLLVRFIIRISQILLIIAKSKKNKKGSIRIVLVDKNISPFSFFNYIFINPTIQNKEHLNHILLHEKEHIIKNHSFDKILVEIISAIIWINPFIWLIKKSLNEIHEYEADNGVIINCNTNTNYIKLIVNQAFGNQFFQLTNNFNYSLIKKRMLMMTKTKSPVLKKLKFLLILPACIGLMQIYSFTNMKPVYFTGFANNTISDSCNDELLFLLPIDYAKTEKVSARFGETILFNNEKLNHKGIDFKAPKGTKVFAAFDGKVSLVQKSDKGYGNQILIDHTETLQSRYAHLDIIIIAEGQMVKKGDVIGSVGNTGKSTGPHLHFEVIKNGQKVNPEDYLGDLVIK
ncbi:peptidoglycan DD-metalloendopeptidase family protein [Bacteroidota bacterium]